MEQSAFNSPINPFPAGPLNTTATFTQQLVDINKEIGKFDSSGTHEEVIEVSKNSHIFSAHAEVNPSKVLSPFSTSCSFSSPIVNSTSPTRDGSKSSDLSDDKKKKIKASLKRIPHPTLGSDSSASVSLS